MSDAKMVSVNDLLRATASFPSGERVRRLAMYRDQLDMAFRQASAEYRVECEQEEFDALLKTPDFRRFIRALYESHKKDGTA